MHPTAEAQFFVVKTGEVVAGGILHRIMVLKISLQNYFTGRLAAAGTAGDLREQLKGALGGAEVRQSQGAVGTDHADQGDAVNVVPLGDHLRAHQQIEFTFIERGKRALEVFVAANRVAIKTRDARLRKHAVQQFFQLLRAGTEKINVLAAA